MATTSKGHIELLPGGSYRVHVFAGKDPVTGRKRYLRRTVKTEARAAQKLAKLLDDAEAGRAPEDAATVGLALDRYLEVADLGVSTRVTHGSYIRRIIRPVLGDVKLRRLGPDTLDTLYAHLWRCSRLCGRLSKTEHYAKARTSATAAAGRCATTGQPSRTPATTDAARTSAHRYRPHRS
jgi:integrase